MPPSTRFSGAASPIRGRDVSLRTESLSSPLPLSWRPVPCQNFHDSAGVHPQDTSILMEHSTTDKAQDRPQSTLQWYMRKPSDDSTEQYYTETKMEAAYPPYAVESSPFMDDEIYACNSEPGDHGGDISFWNAVLGNDFTEEAECKRAILGTDVNMDDAPDAGYMQDLRSSYSSEGSHGHIGSSYRSLGQIELEQEPGGSVEDNAHISTFCWRPYWRT